MAKKGLRNREIGYGRNDLCPCGSGLKYKKCCKPVTRMKTDEEQKADEERRNKSSGVSTSELAQFLQVMARMNMHNKPDVDFGRVDHVSVDYGDLPDRVRIDEK